MIILDAQISQHLVKWINDEFGIETFSVSFLGFLMESDKVIFDYARDNNAIIMTKDDDFIKLIDRYGPPPKVIWINCGNTTNEHLKKVLMNNFHEALDLLRNNSLVEITD